MNSDKQSLIRRVEEKLFEARPALKEIYEQYKDTALIDFIADQYKSEPNTLLDQERKNEVIGVIVNKAEKLLGSEISQSLKRQLEKEYLINTTDHHAPLTHPDYLTSNLLIGLNYARKDDSDLENILILSCANVSFDNYTFPRGHFFHSVNPGSGEILTNQLVFFPRKVRPLTVFGHPSYTNESIDEAKMRIGDWIREKIITPTEQEKLLNILDEIYSTEEILNQKFFSDQVTISNFNLWKKLDWNESKKPNLIYLEQESIVNDLIAQYHLNHETLINKILFDTKMHELLIEHFDGISGGFNFEAKKGTFLFWALPKDQKYRVQLWVKDGKLVSTDQSYNIPLTPESIARAIEEKELLPSTLLSFIILSFYYGLDLVGGGGQTTYLTQMKAGFMGLVQQTGINENFLFLENLKTNRLSFPYQSLTFIGLKSGKEVEANLLDLIVYNQKSCFETVRNNANSLTFSQALFHSLASLYLDIVPNDQHEIELLELSQADIDKLTGFTSKIEPLNIL